MTRRLTFLGAPVSPDFEARAVALAVGDELAYAAADWTDALVVVECGVVDLEGRCGARLRFVSGDVIWLADLPVRALLNPGPEDVTLSVLRRRTGPAGVAYDPERDD